jgi:hypothetical protein
LGESLAEQDPVTRLVCFVMNRAHYNGYRKKDGFVFRPVLAPNGVHTRAWQRIHVNRTEEVPTGDKKSLRVEHLVAELINTHAHMGVDQGVIARNTRLVVSYINSHREHKFTDLVFDRHVLSFTNCVYHLDHNECYRYTDEDYATETAQFTASNYLPVKFPYQKWLKLLDEGTLNVFDDLPTPLLDGVFEVQWHPDLIRNPLSPHGAGRLKYMTAEERAIRKRVGDLHFSQYTMAQDRNAQAPVGSLEEYYYRLRVPYAFGGRQYYEVGHRDSWQVCYIAYGEGGNGKSIHLFTTAAAYADFLVGNMSASCEQVFGIADLVDEVPALRHLHGGEAQIQRAAEHHPEHDLRRGRRGAPKVPLARQGDVEVAPHARRQRLWPVERLAEQHGPTLRHGPL